MKTLITLLSCVLITICLPGAEVKFGDTVLVRKSDLRLVGSTTVDVGPVRAWLQSPQGDRPLKHWKQLQVFNIKGTVSTMTQCVVKTEEGRFEEILIKNLPRQVSDFITDFANEAAAITNLQNEIAFHLASERAAAASAVNERTDVDLETYLENVLTEKAHGEAEAAAVKEKSEALQKLLANHEALRARAAEATSIIAMNTMRRFTNLPVWDCGMQK